MPQVQKRTTLEVLDGQASTSLPRTVPPDVLEGLRVLGQTLAKQVHEYQCLVDEYGLRQQIKNIL
jgi:hypothetical protein